MAQNLWEVKRKVGRPPVWASPEELMQTALEYFQWAEENPLMEAKAMVAGGEVVIEYIPKPRTLTLWGLCAYADTTTKSWSDYKYKPEFSDIIKKIEGMMTEQKFAGAAAGLFNANIIARHLGLTDNQKVEHSGQLVARVERVIVDPSD